VLGAQISAWKFYKIDPRLVHLAKGENVFYGLIIFGNYHLDTNLRNRYFLLQKVALKEFLEEKNVFL